MRTIKRSTLMCTKESFDMLLRMYGQWIIELGPEKAKDMLFENMLTNENIVNLVFFFAVDRMHEIMEYSPAGNLRNFIKNY